MSESIPRPVSDHEKWVAKNRIVAIKAEYRATGADTAETYVHMESFNGEKVCWKRQMFDSVAIVKMDYSTVAEARPGIREKVEAREKYEKENDRELALYKRLKEKFEGTTT